MIALRSARRSGEARHGDATSGGPQEWDSNSGRTRLDMATRPSHRSIDQLLRAADHHLSRNELAQAETVCRRVLRELPDHPVGLLLAATVARRTGQLGRAEQLLDRLLKREPQLAPALYLLAEVYREAGWPRKALPPLIRAIEIEFGLPSSRNAIEFWQLVADGMERDAPLEVLEHCLEPISEVGALLEACGELQAHESTVCRRLAAVDALAKPEPETIARLTALLGLAAFSKQSDARWNRMVFEHALLPWLSEALRAGRYNVALMLESSALIEYAPQTETDQHFGTCVRRWIDAMRAEGRRFGTKLPMLSRSPGASVPGVAFVVHNLSSLAHVRLLVDALEGHASLGVPLIRPLVVCFWKAADPATARIEERIRRTGTEIVAIPPPGKGPAGTAELRVVRDTLAARRVDAVVWVSYVALMPFAFAMTMAPAQIWWAMKYHNLDFEEIDGYLTTGGVTGGTRRIGSRVWRAGPVAAEDWYDAQLAAEATIIRARYAQHRVVYGCFGREEKLNSGPFLDAVCEILRAVPDAGFLWAGRQQHREIQARFDAAGVAQRCHFIGWVNTRLYAQVIDVFLDSFPFPCGFTLYESMAAGKPVVLYASDEAAETGARSMIEPLLLGEQGSAVDQDAARAIFRHDREGSFYLCAQTSSQYASYATRLAADEALRQQAGAAGQQFVARFMSDRRRLGRIYAEHLVAIVRETEARRAAHG